MNYLRSTRKRLYPDGHGMRQLWSPTTGRSVGAGVTTGLEASNGTNGTPSTVSTLYWAGPASSVFTSGCLGYSWYRMGMTPSASRPYRTKSKLDHDDCSVFLRGDVRRCIWNWNPRVRHARCGTDIDGAVFHAAGRVGVRGGVRRAPSVRWRRSAMSSSQGKYRQNRRRSSG